MLELWQPEWDVYPHNNPYRIFPKPNDCISYSCRRGDCDFSATHQSLKYDSYLFSLSLSFFVFVFLLKGEDLPVCIPCDELFIIRYILLFCSDLVEARKRYFTAMSRKMLFEDITLSFGCDFLREINVFGNLCIFGSFYAVFSFFFFFN